MAKQKKPNPQPPKIKPDPFVEMVATSVANAKKRRSAKNKDALNAAFQQQYAASLKAPPTINH